MRSRVYKKKNRPPKSADGRLLGERRAGLIALLGLRAVELQASLVTAIGREFLHAGDPLLTVREAVEALALERAVGRADQLGFAAIGRSCADSHRPEEYRDEEEPHDIGPHRTLLHSSLPEIWTSLARLSAL